MSVSDFFKRHSSPLFRAVALMLLSAIATALVLGFESGALPYSADGDAFDTVYAYETTP